MSERPVIDKSELPPGEEEALERSAAPQRTYLVIHSLYRKPSFSDHES